MTGSDESAIAANGARLRAIYAWLGAAGFVGCSLLGLYFATGGAFEGPVIALAVVAPILAVMGLGLWIARRKTDRTIQRILREEPARIARVFPKATESTLHGGTVAQYTWIVLELTDGTQLDLYASTDFGRVLSEVRRHAPDAEYDPRWTIERTNLRIR